MACLWIFTADLSIYSEDAHDGDKKAVDKEKAKNSSEETNWVKENDFQHMDWMELYATSFYFTVTTITTVGYGDISGTNFTERIICIFLMIIGVLFFSFSSGTLTQIITNYE